MSKSVSIEIDDLEYEVEVTHVDFGYAPSRWDPGAGAEIELGNIVKVWGMVSAPELPPTSGITRPGVINRITMDEFLQIYAAFQGFHWHLNPASARKAAEAKLEDYCLEDVRGQMEGDYDDSDV